MWMKSVVMICLFLNFNISVFATAKMPSSVIPEKREFPLSQTENPCQDFHKYVCSEVESSFKLREDRSMHMFAFSDSSERILEAKKKFFINIKKEKSLSSRDQQVKDYYLACMDMKSGIQQEKDALLDLFSNLQKVKSIQEFYKMNVDEFWQGRQSLLGVWIESNKDNPKIYDIGIASQLMNLPEYSYYDNVELMKDYRKLVVDYFKILEPKAKAADIEKRADDMIEFEKAFVKIFPHPEVLRQRWTEKRQEKHGVFMNKYPNLPMRDLVGKFPEHLLVTNAIPESLEFMNTHSDEKYLPALKDFYLYHVGKGFLDDSNPHFFKKAFELNKKYLGGPNQRPDRHERCTKSVMSVFNREIDALLLPRMFPNFPEEKIQNVATNIRASIIAGVKSNKWLSEESKKKAILKTEKARLFLVKPQNEREWDLLPVKKYSDKKRIENSVLHTKTQIEKMMADANLEVNQEAWGMGPLTVNAYYDASANKFVLPIGILQYPFFVATGDLTENLGAVGTVIGHELGHGIDDQGSKYDENGKLSQWMSMKELGEFQLRGKKMVEQFNKVKHNGSLTLGENIADLVGLTFSYNAAFPEGKGSVEDQKKFFVSYARLWCQVARPKAEENQLKTNPHALGWARINEQVKHQPAFAEAYQCQQGDAMYLPSEERVQIW